MFARQWEAMSDLPPGLDDPDYAAWMLIFARATVRELIAVARKQPVAA